MKTPANNIFTSFRGPSMREDGLGTQLEDNTTKALLHVLDYGDTDIKRAVISALTADTEAHSTILELIGKQSVDIETRTQVQIDDINRDTGQLIFVGVSDNGVDPLETTDDPNISKENPDTSKKRVDGVVTIGDQFTIVEESKFGDTELGISDTADYTATLGIPETRYNIISWLDIYQALEAELNGEFRLEADGIPASDRSTFVAEEFMRYLQIYGLKLSQSDSTYGEDDEGVNTVSLEFQPDMNLQRPLVGNDTIDFAVHFDTVGATGYLDFYVSESEWRALLNELESKHPEARQHLKEGDSKAFFDYIEDEVDPSGRQKLAEIGIKENGRKWLQVAPKSDYYVFGFKYASPGKQEASNGYFMLAETELQEHFDGNESTSTSAFKLLFGEDPEFESIH